MTMTSDGRDIDAILSRDFGSSKRASDDSQATDQWREEGPWLLLLLVPLAALAFRKGLVYMLIFAIMPWSGEASATLWDDLWRSKDQQAQEKFEADEVADAAALFEDPKWRAAANYRAGNYPNSAQGFAEYQDLDSRYNLANALAKQGRLEAALGAYDEVLELQPEHEDAIYNRDLVEKALQQQQQSESEQNQSSDESGGEGEQSESNQQSQQDSKEGASADADSEQSGDASARGEDEMNQQDLEAMQAELDRAAQEAEKEGEEAESEPMTQAEAEAMRRAQEQQQAMEQWLRRIPNDPGGLLRRKFQYQYQRLGRDQDGNSLWPDDETQPW